MTAMTDHTQRNYKAFTEAYDFFNTELFVGELPKCLVTFQRQRRAFGYFWADKFADASDGAAVDEIAMNPQLFEGRTHQQTLSTLVHEMAHLWQHHYGSASRNGYHNKEWGSKMLEVGLHPSDTGTPGGRKTGQQMSHYILEGGPFATSCKKLLDSGFQIPYFENQRNRASTTSQDKVKFMCPSCRSIAWGKPALKLLCGECVLDMTRA